MRADENMDARTIGCHKLRAFLRRQVLGARIPIEDWYLYMNDLGLQHSARQRLSELKKEGLLIEFDKGKKEYHYKGWFNGDFQQQELPLTA
jgi:hypothetical protein